MKTVIKRQTELRSAWNALKVAALRYLDAVADYAWRKMRGKP